MVAQLVKYGADIWAGEGDYPDLTPLYLAIARPRDTQDLDGPLRIACSYALSRTCRYLLTRGADPNKIGRLGLAAIHSAVMKRLPWRNFPRSNALLDAGFDSITRELWTSMMLCTVYTLLWFGADPNLPSETSRVHSCRHQCWRSPDCNRGGQTALHFACGNGDLEVVQLLLERGADPEATDNEGYLPLFSAICQDHTDLAMWLLQDCLNPAGLMIVQPHQSTALHIACRFAMPELVDFLLEDGADANATDIFGRTPLHEVMGQTSWELEDRVLETLHLLADHGALPDLISGRGRGRTARDMAAQHPFSRVRELF